MAILGLIVLSAIFLASLAASIFLLRSLSKRGDERREFIILKACANTFLVTAAYLIVSSAAYFAAILWGAAPKSPSPLLLLAAFSLVYFINLWYLKRKYGG
jgi:hypothetical protein